MCGRYTLTTADLTLAELLGLDEPPELEPRYNIAPSQDVAVLRAPAPGGGRRIEMLRWGLIPSWAKEAAIGQRMINARSETAPEKPAFRAAFRQRRCLIPADGFYEWQKVGPAKQPYYIRLRDHRPFAMAGLWERWPAPDGTPIESCTILTTSASKLLEPIHERTPVILQSADFELWLDPRVSDPASLRPLLRPFTGDEITAVAVSKLVNSPANDSPACIEPLGGGR